MAAAAQCDQANFEIAEANELQTLTHAQDDQTYDDLAAAANKDEGLTGGRDDIDEQQAKAVDADHEQEAVAEADARLALVAGTPGGAIDAPGGTSGSQQPAPAIPGTAQLAQTRADDDADAWQKLEDQASDADKAYAYAAAGVQDTQVESDATIDQTFNDAVAQAAYDQATGVDAATVAAELAAATAQQSHDIEQAGYTADQGSLNAQLIRALDKSSHAATYQKTYADDEQTWAEGVEGLDQTEEIAVDDALAGEEIADSQAQADDLKQGAQADQTEADNVAAASKTYFNDLATDQQTQDVADATAEQTFANGTADAYSTALANWTQPGGNGATAGPAAGNRWAIEQAAWAAADDAWTHAVTAAELADVQQQDAAQVAWTSSAAQADYNQTIDDAAAAAGAIEQQAQDAADAASADATAWQTEVAAVAGATTTYDDAAIDAADTSQKSQAAQASSYASDLASNYIDWELTTASIDWQLFLGNITPLQAGDQHKVAQVALATENANDSVTYGAQIAGDYGTEISTVGTAKVKWITDGLKAEAAYAAAIATGTAKETTSDANAWSALVTNLADDERDWETSLANADLTLTTAASAADQTLATAEAGATATDEEAYVNAAGTYETNLWSDFQTSLANAASAANSTADPLGFDLAKYNASVVQALSQEVAGDANGARERRDAIGHGRGHLERNRGRQGRGAGQRRRQRGAGADDDRQPGGGRRGEQCRDLPGPGRRQRRHRPGGLHHRRRGRRQAIRERQGHRRHGLRQLVRHRASGTGRRQHRLFRRLSGISVGRSGDRARRQPGRRQ